MAEKLIYVRAKPASVKLIEYYFYEKKLSRNPFIGPGQPPVGKIEIIMPMMVINTLRGKPTMMLRNN
jgi:hypothetical protein